MKITKTLKHLFYPQKSNNHRPKILHPRPMIFMSLIALGFFQIVGIVSSINLPQGNILGYASSITVAQVIEGTNRERASQGLVQLTYNGVLSEAALAKAQDMFNNQYWAHTSPTGKEPWDFIKSVNYNYKVAGENLARDFDSTGPMISAWMNSPTHRANIMNPRYRDIGLAVVDGKLNGTETTLVVQMFGTMVDGSVTNSNPSVEVPAVTVAETKPVVTNTPVPVNVVNKPQTKENLEIDSQEVIEVDANDLENSSPNDVLAIASVPQGSLSQGILMSPLHVLKAFFLSIIFLIVVVLIYDFLIIGHKKPSRLVGKNLAHIILFIFIAYLIVFFKGGAV